MKLTDMTTEQAKNVMCDLVEKVNSILSDEGLRIKLEEYKNSSDFSKMTYAEKISFGVEVINFFIPYVLKTKEQEVYEILSAMNNMSVEEIKAQRFGETLKQIKEIINDEELKELFI